MAAGTGEPTVSRLGASGGDTCHVDVIDRWGNMVSATPSAGWLQSSPAIPELGFCLGSRCQMFWLDESLPNGLKPGKRPRTTLSPSMVLRDDGTPWMSFGTPGGEQQDQWQPIMLARMLDHLLTPMGFAVRIVDQWSPATDRAADMWIVIAPFWHRLLPPPDRRIAFQVEQFTDARRLTRRYLDDLRASFAVFDYSRANIDHFRRMGLDLASIHHVPLTPVPMTAPSNPPRGGEVLFYGETQSPRRAECLAALAQSCPLRVESALFGDAMLDRIAAARLVVNIHRSPDAILETTRVCECLSLGTPVLSEDSIDQGDHPLIESLIRFVPRGDIPAMQAAVAAALAEPFQPPDLDAAMQNSADHLRRAMADLGFGLA